jgi:hypothetical protein
MVLGTPTQLMPRSAKGLARRHGAVAADDDERLDAVHLQRGHADVGHVLEDRRAVVVGADGELLGVGLVGRAEDRAAAGQDVGDVSGGRAGGRGPRSARAKPSSMPMTSIPWNRASLVTARMTALRPGQSPPPVSTDASLYLHPQTLARLGSFELRAKMIVEGVMSGMHRSPYQGSASSSPSTAPTRPATTSGTWTGRSTPAPTSCTSSSTSRRPTSTWSCLVDARAR